MTCERCLLIYFHLAVTANYVMSRVHEYKPTSVAELGGGKTGINPRREIIVGVIFFFNIIYI